MEILEDVKTFFEQRIAELDQKKKKLMEEFRKATGKELSASEEEFWEQD